MANSKRSWSPPQIIWSALAGMLALSALGFGWFGYGFGWQTPASATQATTDAVVANLAAICVAQARAAPDAESALKEFAALSRWKRTSFVEEADWAIMPGADASHDGVATECASRLAEAT